MPSLRALSLSEAVALAYSDPDCSSSSSPSLLSPPSANVALSQRHRDRRPRSTRGNLLTSAFLLLLALPIATAIFDPGESESSSNNNNGINDDDAQSAKPSPRRGLSSSVDSSLSLLAPNGQPVSLHPGCRRTSSLFDNVCQNPWLPQLKGAIGRSELVICPIRDETGEEGQEGERERVFAITGTITLPETTYEGIASSSSSFGSLPVEAASLGDKEAHWPKPGDEGFWRQRDGEVEWVPTEPRALVEDDIPAALAPSETEKDKHGGAQDSATSSDAAQAKEYDAWSASIGGEESETWLSFDLWRERHLAAEREQEKQKSAAGRKQTREKAKEKKGAAVQANNTTDRGTEGHQAGAGQAVEANATAERSMPIDATLPVDAVDKQGMPPPEALETEVADVGPEEGQSDLPSETSLEDVQEPSVVRADSSQDTGAIPAVGNPSSQLSTLKHRWNFASLDCAALVHRSNPSAKLASSILSEKKDRYMLSPCPESGSDGQFVVVELCDEISVDTIVLANYEFFSRMFKKFRVRVSRNLNGGEEEWYDIGTFRARNVRGLQVFNTVPPTADSRFFRYVRIDFMEHYGSEYYCPISLLRVYGLTQMDDYVREEEEMRKQREAELLLAGVEEEDEAEEEGVKEGGQQSANRDAPVEATSMASTSAPVTETLAPPSVAPSSTGQSKPTATASGAGETAVSGPQATVASSDNGDDRTESADAPPQGLETALSKPMVEVTDLMANISNANGSASPLADASVTAAAVNSTGQGSVSMAGMATPEQQTPSTSGNTTAHAVPSVETKERAANATISSSMPSHQESNRATGGGGQQQHHGGSESIYRTITKRLNTLETNATLSLQYLEHSRQQLREVFGRMERNQKEKIGEMLRELNASNWRQIESLKRRQQVDLQQAIFEFDQHRQQTDAERRALLAQVHILSNEVMLEKRFGIAQLVLLLGLFVFMALTRGSRAAPLIHQGIARISKSSFSPLQEESAGQAASPAATIRAATPRGRQNSIEGGKGSPSRHNRTLSAASRTEKKRERDRVMGGGLERVVRLRGSNKGRRGHSISLLPSPRVAPSPNQTRQRDGHVRHGSIGSLDSRSQKQTYSLAPRPKIRLDTSQVDCEQESSTPISRPQPSLPSHALRRSNFDRQVTPTNFQQAVLPDESPADAVPPSSRSVTGDESFGSDWGTERSDEEESLTSPEVPAFRRSPSPIVAKRPEGAEAEAVAGPYHGTIRRIEESDAEEDSPAWSPVKSRRSMKRSGSIGSGTPNHGTISRVQTPTNVIPSPRRTFSPFHKNTEIEIN